MSEKKQITEEIYKKCIAPFPPEAVHPHESKPYLSTIKAMYVIERLNNVFGVGRWNIEHEIIKETEDYVLVKGKLILHDFDITIPTQYGGHKTTGKGIELADGYKSAVTDVLSKTASYLGIGLDVFKGLVNPLENKNKFKPLNQPDLPKIDMPKKPEIPDHNTSKNDQVTYISERILEMTAGNFEDAAKMLELLSQFKNKDGTLVPGYTSFKTMIEKASEKRISVIYGHVKKEYENWAMNI